MSASRAVVTYEACIRSIDDPTRTVFAPPTPHRGENVHENDTHGGLHTPLKQKHLTMIALGGTMGAGLFIGSGAIISEVGPASIVTYALTGVLILMVMRMLGEMAVANPRTGSFTDYARDAMGNWAGFSTAWLYWYYQMVVVGFEAVIGAQLLQRWIHGVPAWVLSIML